MSESSSLSLSLPVALMRFWPGEGDDGWAVKVAQEVVRHPGVVQLGERLFAALPVAGRAAVFDTLVKLGAELQARLLRTGTGREISGILVFPGQVLQTNQGIELITTDSLMEDLDRQAPELPYQTLFASGYASSWLQSWYRFGEQRFYEAPSGRRVPLMRLKGEAAEPHPWHNPEILGRHPRVLRPEVSAAIEDMAEHPAFRLRGPMGSGKSHAAWHFLAEQAGAKVWVATGRALPGTAIIARRLVRDLCRLAPRALPIAAGELRRTETLPPGEAANLLLTGLANLRKESGQTPWVVCDMAHGMTEEDSRLLGEILTNPLQEEACRFLLVGRHGLKDADQISHLPEIEIGSMTPTQAEQHRQALLNGLSIDPEMEARWAKVLVGNPFALEEGLLGLVHSGQIRRVYGSFFYNGDGTEEYTPSVRWVRHVEAEIRRLGEPLPLRILAAAGQAVAASHLELVVDSFGTTLAPEWENPFVRTGLIQPVETAWGGGYEFVAGAFRIALNRVLADESRVLLRHALGKVLVAEPKGSSLKEWQAYRLLAGSPEAVPQLLDFSRDSDDSASRHELFEALLSEYRALQKRQEKAKTELDLLWSMLPLSRRLGRLDELSAELARALELAKDHPRRYVPLLCLQGELDQEKGRFEKAEAGFRRALAASEGSDPRRRAQIFMRLGVLLMRRERLAEAREIFSDLLQVVVNQGQYQTLVASCYFYLGNIFLRERQLEEALKHLEQALEMRRGGKNGKTLGASLSAVGAVHLMRGDYPKALEFYQEAEEILQRQSDGQEELSLARRGCGRALSRLGDHLGASRPLRQALLVSEGGDVVLEASARLDVAANQLQLGKVSQALEMARQAHFQFSLIPETSQLGDAEQLLGRIFVRQRQEEDAKRHFSEALRIHRLHGDAQEEVMDISWLLEVALLAGDQEAILSHGKELESLLVNVRHPAQGEILHYRLFKGFDWLVQRKFLVPDPITFLRHAYGELMRQTEFLEADLRHRFLFQNREYEEILNAAAKSQLTWPGV